MTSALLDVLAAQPEYGPTLRRLVCELAIAGRLLPRAGDWTEHRLDNIVSVRGGSTPSMARPEYWGGDIPWVSPKDMHAGEIVTSEMFITQEALAKTNLELVPLGSVLIVGRSGILKRKLPAQVTRVPCTVNQDIKALTPSDVIDSAYLRLWLLGSEREILAEDVKTGTTVQSLVFQRLFARRVLLPPISEQIRIVAKVAELMALCDRLEARQQDAEAAHGRLVQALLGSLTNARDAAEFQTCWVRLVGHFDSLLTTDAAIEDLKATILQFAVTGRLTGETTPFALPADCLSDLPPLAQGWVYKEFNELIDPGRPIAYGVLVPGPEVEGGVPFVRIADLSIEFPARLPEKTIAHDVDAKFSRTRLVGGEILMGVVGSVGKLGVAPPSWAGANIARAICRIVPAQGINTDFVLLLLRSDLMRRQFLGDTRTLAQPTLNVGLIRAAKAPVPPLDQQDRVVRTAHALLDLCDQLKARIAAGHGKHAQLAEALVAHAIAA